MACNIDLAPFLAHGGRVGLARATCGGDDWIDLSTGIAPWAWPVGDQPLALDRLPEPDELAALEAAAAFAFGAADRAHVVAVPGTDLALRLLPEVVPARHAAVVQPGYAGHAAAWPAATPVVADSLAQLDGHDLLVLSSPANPDGRVTDPIALQRLTKSMTVLVDEAYADPSHGLCPFASDRLIVLRSFGKFYGLPGLRLGFVVAGPRVAAALRRMLGDWPVSSAAIAIGTAAYRDLAWRKAQAARIEAAGVALDGVLAASALAVAGTAPLFRLVTCDDGAALFRHLAGRAILTRPFADQPQRIRIGLPADDGAIGRLTAALQEHVP